MTAASISTASRCRDDFERAIGRGALTEAKAALENLWREQPGSANAAWIVSRFGALRGLMPLRPCRLRILRSFTLEPAIPMLRAAALLGGIDLTVDLCDHNAYAQEFLDPASRLYREPHDAVILAVQLRDIAPALYEESADRTPAERAAAADEVLASFREWLRAMRSRSDAAVVVHSFEVPEARQGVLDAQVAGGQSETVRALNARLAELAREFAGVWVLDYDSLVRRHGSTRWHDEQKWRTVRLPIAADALNFLCAEWLRFLHPITGRVAKVLVTDLDNTLWGGVVGEDGLAGIRVDGEYKGAGYLALQRAMLDLYRRGVLLAIASKNNEEDALQVFAGHRSMLLRREHFAATRINWRDKADNLREIAAELNLGLDSLVFLDDNPVERDRVRTELPEVTVVDLPADPMSYAAALRDVPLFERLALSEEDSARQRFYAEQRMRTELQRESGSLEGFYRSLRQVVEIEVLRPADIPRAAQLTQKTNQFNLTGKRFSEAQLTRMRSEPDWEIFTVRVIDRFGDNGLVGVCVTAREDGGCGIETFLLSCRVIGRTVESAIVHFVAERYRRRGAKWLAGRFTPTSKNKPAASFYENHGFEPAGRDGESTLWRLDLERAVPACPEWIQLSCPAGETESA